MTAKSAKFFSSLFNLIVVLAMLFGPLTQIPAQAFTDTTLQDYPPGSVVTVYGDNSNGAGYLAGETVLVSVTQPVLADPLTCTAIVQADGTWTCDLQLNSDPALATGLYEYTTLGLTSGVTETHSFTDSPPVGVNFSQCHNNLGEGPCAWGNGDINHTNSFYYEGDGSPQRVYLTNLTAGTPMTFTIEYLSTKSSKHAYDYLTTYNFSETYVTQAVLCDGFGSTCTGWSATQALMPKDPLFTSGAPAYPVHQPADQYMTVFNGTALSVTAPVVLSGTPYSGDVTMQISVTFTPSGTDALLAFAGHIASELDWGVGNSAIAISGSSYHIKFEGRDNQLATSAIAPVGTIIIAKDAVPNDGQSFPFTLGGVNNTVNESFSLVDNGTDAALASKSFTVSSGTYSAAESTPAGWDLTSATCSDGSPVTAISLQEGETVTCTFTNTEAGHIIVKKETSPDGMTGSFQFNPSWSETDFYLSDGGSNDSGALSPGTYSVSEVGSTIWSSDGGVCSDGSPVSAIELSAGETVTCTFTNTRLWNKDLSVTKTATPSFGRTYLWLIDKSVDKTEIDTSGSDATFNYSVKVTPNGSTDAAWAVSGKITVSNPNSFDVAGVDVSDTIDNGGACTVTGGEDATIPAGGSADFDYSCAYTAAPTSLSGTNTAVASWNASTYNTPNGSASGTADVDFSAVSPSETNKTITVIDDKTNPENPVTLGTSDWSSGPFEYNYALTLAAVAGTCKSYTNTAVIDETGQSDPQTVKVCAGKDLTVTKDATASLDRTYQWLIEKSVDATTIKIASGGTATFNYSVKVTPNGVIDSNYVLGGTITIANPNDWEDIEVGAADTLDAGGACRITEEGPTYTVPAAKSITLHYTCTTDGSSQRNTATVVWDSSKYSTPTGTASGSSDITFALNKETNKTITVVDDETDPLNPVTLGTSDSFDGPFEYTYSLNKSGEAGTCTDYTNTAEISETGQSDDQTVTVCVGKDLTVSKTAAGSFDRTYLWKIAKDVNETSVKIADGLSYTFHYTVTADQTGISDSGWTLSGMITITNPNDWEDVTLTSLSDVVDNGGLCTVAPGPYEILRGGSLPVNYTCTYASAPANYSGTNTVTATWDYAAYFTPGNTASEGVAFTLSQVGAINQTIHVIDSYAGELGTVTATDGEPFETGTFTYDRTESGTAGTCVNYDNTATITETKDTASQSVKLCVGQDLTVSKTASPSFTRTWNWNLDKISDATYNLFAGQSVTHDYKVSVAPTPIDSLWKVTGEITIVNPNDWESITANVADSTDLGGACAPDDPNQAIVTVPAGGSVIIPYTCTWTDQPESYTGTNSVTVTWDKTASFTPNDSVSGSAAIEFSNPTEINPVVTVNDDNLTGEDWSASRESNAWPYTKDVACSSDPAAYKDGTYSTQNVNTAIINETGQTATATVDVNCYAPVVSKTAVGTYDERHEWDVTKTVDPASQSAFAGDTVSYQWTVNVVESVFEENFKIGGAINVVNPAPMEMTVDLADSLGGGSSVPIGSCTNGSYADGKLTIPANTTASCAYAVEPGGRTETVNNVTATLNGIEFGASKEFTWSANVIRESVTLDDDQNPAFPLTISNGDTWQYTEYYTCSTDKSAYNATSHKYTFGESNTATVKSGETLLDSDSASTAVDCYVPMISKDANGTYDEVHTWTLNKTVDPTSQDKFAGEKADFTWTVTVGESEEDQKFLVAGKITLVNPNPEDALTVSLSDVLNDGSIATIGPCTGGTWVEPDLTVPAGGTATCDYSTVPTGRYNLNALAAALPDTVTMKVSYPTVGGSAYFPVTTVTNGGLLNGTYEGWCIDTDHTIYENTNYTAKVYSSYENLPAGLVGKPQNLDLVNWIINQDFVGKPAGGSLGDYTYSDVQFAIWTLIEINTSTSGLYSLNTTRAAQIVALAQANGEGFMPTCGDFVAVILQPVDGSQTITIAQVTFASLGVNCADTNVATAVLNGIKFPASAKILWTANPIDPMATLIDEQGDLNEVLSGGKVFTIPDSHTCSLNPADYTYGFYKHPEDNTATLSTLTDPAKVSTLVNCYAPVVTKTAESYWNRKWDWSITKESDAAYNLFAGDTVTHGYTVAVDPTSTDDLWGVKGTITVYNYHPTENMTLTSLTDLAGGISGAVTCPSLVVPANGSLECTYDTGEQNSPNDNPFGTLNTATASFAGVNWLGTAPITFSATPTTEDNPVITVDDDNVTGEDWSASRASAEWTYTKDFVCSTNAAAYTNGSYSYSLTNTATINETGQKDTAKVDVTCYWPEIELTKTGDALSKIGDAVSYGITLENKTPTEAGLRALSCKISDATIGFSKTVELVSGAKDENLNLPFTIPAGAADPFVNTASVTCKPVAATEPVVGSSTFTVGDSSSWSTNLFQPKVEILKTGPLYATSGDVITFTFTINNLSSSDSPNLMLDSVSDDVLGDLKAAALAGGCDDLVYNGSCTFSADYTVPDVGLQAINQKNIVTLHTHPAGFPNDITDTDDHTVTIAPRGQLTDTSFCPLPNNQFRLLYRLQVAPNIYLLNGSNPGQFYYNAFYFGAPGSTFSMDIEIPYPFMTQEGAGNPIQVHDGTALTSSGCYAPNPSLDGFTVTTEAMSPVSAAGSQIITPEDFTTKQMGQTTTVTVSGTVPSTGFAYVTIHLDYGLKKTSPWKTPGTSTLNPVTNVTIADMTNQTGFGNGPVTIHGYEVYNFSRTVGSDTAESTPSSYNEIKKFAGFLGFVDDANGDPKANVMVVIYNPKGDVLATLYTDEDGYYMYAYKHTAKSATYTVKLPTYGLSASVLVKANGFAAIDFEVQ